MTDLTPERRAELRGLAESAQPFIRHGGTDPAAVYVPAADLTALLDAADERDRLAAFLSEVRDQVARGALCPMCSTGMTRQTVGMVCQLCGTDYGRPEYASHRRDPRRIEAMAAVERVRALYPNDATDTGDPTC